MSMLEVSCMLRRQLEVARVSLSRCMLAYLEKMPVNTAAQLVVLVISICPRLKMVMFGRRTEGRALQVFMKLYEAQRSGKLAGIIPSNTCFSLSNVDVRPAIRITSTSRLE
ncbi:hypothetical protein IWW54_003671 [Coemansia sp. RSA 2705]|nr:hypothetical protein IWW54_003671 [Coemansia sp. RSA 2705]